jgi:hypothetical protein
MAKVIILNGPPCVGKDTLAHYFLEHLPYSGNPIWVEHASFAKPLKQLNQIIYNLTDAEVKELDSNHILKNTPQERFRGKSWRQVNIDISLKLKEEFGQDYFGKHLVQRIEAREKIAPLEPLNVVLTDGGFEEEAIPLIKKYGHDNVHVIKLIRKDCDYSKDSRKYLDCEKLGIPQHDLHNIFLDKYLLDGRKLIMDILK